MYSLSVGDEFIDPGSEAYVSLENIVHSETSGYIDMNTPNTYTLQYYAIDDQDNEETVLVKVLVLSNYYQDAVGLSGNELLLELRYIINTNVTMQNYDAARYILNITDRDPNNPDNVILVYTGYSVDGDWYCPASNDCTWNREHVWPQSLLDVNTTGSSTHVGADLHNLKPADPGTNSSRGNKYFDNTTTTLSYAPRDEVKGDIARMLFYMTVMYDYLELINGTPTTYQMAMLDILIEWHEQDVVDEFEQNRNDVIYTYQNNRNPFIDYPDFYALIFNPNYSN
ncbi:endonuclease [Peloplasma aerotolerans]|uniref:Endonuclease n=1 Tax=Peloplasma aerotolerans TaxID=3044389 RepID=A0AAW6U9E5_9MOLU|nr:endonuclease [Mariniplasma sp. M4Ah]MDI6453299.1 endonuclease [Mariniplasma sp. M4Ah]MDR4968393.1 endonuclease [Acholeplasmataceae bacterium]